MKHSYKLAIVALTVGILLSANLSAFNNSCRRAGFIDVRGNADLDTNNDGKVTIAEVAIANPLNNLDTLVTAVTLADEAILATLSDTDERLTVFAPDNEAFANIPEAILEDILADQDILTSVLLYHVVDGKFDPRKVWFIRSADSLLGQDLFVKRGRSNPTVNQSNIGCNGVLTDNGYVWIIDSVLQPQF